jgi:hypothetical protein
MNLECQSAYHKLVHSGDNLIVPLSDPARVILHHNYVTLGILLGPSPGSFMQLDGTLTHKPLLASLLQVEITTGLGGVPPPPRGTSGTTSLEESPPIKHPPLGRVSNLSLEGSPVVRMVPVVWCGYFVC